MLLRPILDVIDPGGELPRLLSTAIRMEAIAVRWHRDVDEWLERRQELPEQDAAEAPGCLVLKVMDPGLEALDPYLRLKARHLDRPVIIVSRHGNPALAVASFKLKAFDYFSEPVATAALVSSIKAALRRQRVAAGPRIPSPMPVRRASRV